jgi:hypothetical protein
MELRKILGFLWLLFWIGLIIPSIMSFSEKTNIIQLWNLVEWKIISICNNQDKDRDIGFCKIQVSYECNWVLHKERSQDNLFMIGISKNDMIKLYCDDTSSLFVIDRIDTKYVWWSTFFLWIIAFIFWIFSLIWYYRRYDLKTKWTVLNTKISKIESEETRRMWFYNIEYKIYSECKESGKTYYFKSDEFISQKMIDNIKIWDPVSVFVKPWNYSIYVMDVTGSFPNIKQAEIASKPSILLVIFWMIIWIIGLFMIYWAYFFSKKQTQEEVSASYVILVFSLIFLIIAGILLYKFFKHSSPKS